MKILLDTHAFLWMLMDSRKLSPDVVDALTSSNNQVYVSAVSFWEISLKHSAGKLDLADKVPSDLLDAAKYQMGLHLLDLSPEVASAMGRIPRLHGDPFDRMLMHQAIQGGFCLVSADRQFALYSSCGLKLLW